RPVIETMKVSKQHRRPIENPMEVWNKSKKIKDELEEKNYMEDLHASLLDLAKEIKRHSNTSSLKSAVTSRINATGTGNRQFQRYWRPG
ncbi:hypothetical protein BGX21_009320, partial [Mortierella sp. AD011]